MTSEKDSTSLEGWQPELGSPQALRDALQKAFDYRGDVTLGLTGGELVEGFLFNCRLDQEPARISIYPASPDAPPRHIAVSDIESLVFSGKDMATGNSWESWVAKWEAKHGPRSLGQSSKQ